MSQKVLDVMVLKDFKTLVFFKDGFSVKADIKEMRGKDRLFGNILSHEEIFGNIRVSPGGNGIEWDEERFISAEKLRSCGTKSDITYEDVNGFIIERLADTAETTRLLNCSRQYVNQLVDSKRLNPVRESGNTSIFPKSVIETEF